MTETAMTESTVIETAVIESTVIETALTGTAATTADIEDRITELLSEDFGIPRAELAGEGTFEQLDIDSLVLVELALKIKKEWGVLLAEGELEPTHTVADAAALVAAKAVRG
ncbi:acyl carrier protein [Actinokineospora inagensis]|uniref:acyl carrier protein n=1 Tax=Actinokineospora inagensis TaxID=103730 RepID=UPI001B7F8347|nr:acyl carrier protein [Actinokineospora inagensis]